MITVADEFVESLRTRVNMSAAGTIRLCDAEVVEAGVVVAITDVQVDEAEGPELVGLVRLAVLLAAFNSSLAELLVIGWWTEATTGEKFVDVGLLLDDVLEGLAVGRVFGQRCIAELSATCAAEWRVPSRRSHATR